MKKSRTLLLAAILLATSLDAMAAVTLKWTLPTQNEDGTPLAASDIKAVIVYKNDVAVLPSLPATATAYRDANASGCKADKWGVSVTSVKEGKQGTGITPVDVVACAPAPKPPVITGVIVD